MVPVRDVPRTAASPLKCGHHVAPSVPRKRKTPKETTQGGRAGQRHHLRVHQDSRPVSPVVCSPLCGVATPRVLRTLLRVDFLPEELQGRGLPGDLVHGLSPTFSRRSFREEASLGTFKLKKSGSSAAALWANSSSIYARPYPTDLRPVVPKPDDRKTMSSLNCPLKCTRDDTSNKERL